MDNPNCDGKGPHTTGEVRRYPTGSNSAAILCLHCWAEENRYRWAQCRPDLNCKCPDKRPIGTYQHEADCPCAAWPQEDWETAEVYTGG